jgi:hypothetical protein
VLELLGTLRSGFVGRAGSDAAELGAAATSLLLGRAPDAVLTELFGAEDCHLMAGIAHRRGPNEVARRYDWLRARLDTPLVEVLPGPKFVAVARKAPTAAVLDELRWDGWLTVVGTAGPASALAAAGTEVESLLQRARVLGRPLVAEAAGLGLAAAVDPAVARGFAEKTLAPLKDRDGELVTTLRAWLANHGGWDRTATELGLHRNSVRHRIGQVEKALGVDLADPETRMELWFALRWHGHTDQRQQCP